MPPAASQIAAVTPRANSEGLAKRGRGGISGGLAARAIAEGLRSRVQTLLNILKASGRISSPLFLLGFVAFCLVLMAIGRVSRAGRRLLVAGIVLYAFLATPLGSQLLTAPLVRGYTPIASREQARDAGVVVMMGAGIRSYRAAGLTVDDLNNSALRVLEVARLYKLIEPRVTIVSGGNTGGLNPPRPEAAAFKTALVGLGVPPERVVVEDRSLTTREEGVMLRPVLESLGARRFILVTSPMHMWRSMRVFRAQELDPIPSPSVMVSDATRLRPLVPHRDALAISDAAIYEYAAIVYYWMRGWL